MNEVASHWAAKPVAVYCPVREAWEEDDYSNDGNGSILAYVDFIGGTWMRVAPFVCLDAAALASGRLRQRPRLDALAVLIVTHEAFHLRDWDGNDDEGRVECRSIQSWRASMRLLGAPRPMIRRLWPLALKAHRGEADNLGYRDPGCPY